MSLGRGRNEEEDLYPEYTTPFCMPERYLVLTGIHRRGRQDRGS